MANQNPLILSFQIKQHSDETRKFVLLYINCLLDEVERTGENTMPRSSKSPYPLNVRAARLAVGGSRESFAAALNVPVATLRNWEQGRHPPSGAALTLLRMVEQGRT